MGRSLPPHVRTSPACHRVHSHDNRGNRGHAPAGKSHQGKHKVRDAGLAGQTTWRRFRPAESNIDNRYTHNTFQYTEHVIPYCG